MDVFTKNGRDIPEELEVISAEYSDTFHLANNDVDGNVSYRLYEGGTHGPEASNQYTFNALLWFWND